MLEKKEYSLDKREESVISRENLLEERRAFFEQKTAELEKKNLEIEEKKNVLQEKMNNVISYLEKAAHMSEDEAKDELMKKIEEIPGMMLTTGERTKKRKQAKKMFSFVHVWNAFNNSPFPPKRLNR